MRHEAAVSPQAALGIDLAVADLFDAAAHPEQSLAQCGHALWREEHRVAQAGGAFLLVLRGARDRGDAQDAAQRQIEAEQAEQQDEKPAGEDAVEAQQQDRAVEGAVILRVPGDFPFLRDHGADHRAGRDQHQQQYPEAHGAQVSDYFFHGRSFADNH